MPRSEAPVALRRASRRDGGVFRVARTAVAIAFLLAAASAPLTAQADATSPPAASPLLWRVRSDSATIYLYGSIHAAAPDAVPPPPVVRHAFTQSDELATEVVLDGDLTSRLSEAIAERSELPPERELRDYLDDEGWRRVRLWASSAGFPVESLERLQPWLVEMLVAETDGLPEGFTAENGLDAYFSAKATARGMPQRGLETVEDQLDALAGGSFEEQARSLLQAVEHAGDTEKIERLYRAWSSGDASAIEAVILDQYGAPGFAGAYDRLFTRRNEAWMDPLVDYLSGEATVFVVVGAGHLVGVDSVLELLLERGYPVTRLHDPADIL